MQSLLQWIIGRYNYDELKGKIIVYTDKEKDKPEGKEYKTEWLYLKDIKGNANVEVRPYSKHRQTRFYTGSRRDNVVLDLDKEGRVEQIGYY